MIFLHKDVDSSSIKQKLSTLQKLGQCSDTFNEALLRAL